MCGICGFIDLSHPAEKKLEMTVAKMSDAITHRGPDDHGVWVDQECGVALGHRRLSILDLSTQGRQPMISHSGRYVIVYNGEIYNFKALKSLLAAKGYTFQGHSDTEVLLAAIEDWGLEKTLQDCNGMFAFALWDRKERTLHLARDRMGKKPLYYGWAGQSFVFSSELKAFHRHPSFEPAIDHDVLALYCRHNYIPAPWSIYKNIYKLTPASFVSLSFTGPQALAAGQPVQDRITQYWNIRHLAEQGEQEPLTDSIDEATDTLEPLLREAVKSRMIADVPLGAFLSGGIDSSLIVALMQNQSSRPVKTFSIGFEEASCDETHYAKKVAGHLGTEHTEFFVSAKEALATIPRLPQMFDEPFADPSAIPTWHVANLARQHVTVALSGDGGDEAFAGYTRYLRGQKLIKMLLMPKAVRGMTSLILSNIPIEAHQKLSKLIAVLEADNEDDFYRQIMSYWHTPEKLVRGAKETQSVFTDQGHSPALTQSVNRMAYWDMISYLPDDILAKVDRTSMSVGLEARNPLLDYRVIEFSQKLPLSLKIENGNGKRVLRKLLSRYLPEHLFERPKQGFGIPHGEWLRGPLREWAEDLLSEDTMNRQGFFDTALVRDRWKRHCESGQDWSYQLWGILMFQAWYAHWHDK